MAHATLAIGIAVLLEVAVGELPGRSHPVAALGTVIEFLDRSWATPRLAGVGVALSLPLAAALLAAVPVRALETVSQYLAAGLAGLILFTAISLRMLLGLAGDVIAASETDRGAARDLVIGLVGRDTGELSGAELRSAAVESLAENFSDGFLAPLSAFVALSFVSIPAAAAGAAFIKGANTMDSMLGYPGPFGWGSARLDDLVMFVPARLSAPFLALGAGDPDAPLRARRYVHNPASPNAGWPMGTLAAALNVRLEKPGVYTLNGVASHPTVPDGRDAIDAIRRAAVLVYASAALVGVVRWL